MLTIDLVRLKKERGPVRIREEVPEDSPLFQDTDIQLASALTVDLEASLLNRGEVIVRGGFSGVLSRKCRRCLEPVRVPLDEKVDLLFVPEDELGPEEGEEEDETRRFDPMRGALDLAEAIREEVVLAAPLYVECDPECRGLCPRCGKNLNEGDCDCVLDEPDPRWDALRAINRE